MRPFSFPLEQVRSLRSHVETAAKAALARELATGAEREAELRRADEALASARDCAQPTGQPASGADLSARQLFLERRERERTAAELAARTHEEVVAERVAELESAASARAALDRLRDRKLAAHTREVARVEEAALGEVALRKHVRGESGR
jgi:flagellar export protein FliJ